MINNQKRTVAKNSAAHNSTETFLNALKLVGVLGVITISLAFLALIGSHYPFIFVSAILTVAVGMLLKACIKTDSTKDIKITKNMESRNNKPKSNIEKLKNNKSWQAKIRFYKALQELDVPQPQGNLLETLFNALPPVEAGTPAAEARRSLFKALQYELHKSQSTNETVASRTRSRLRKS